MGKSLSLPPHTGDPYLWLRRTVIDAGGAKQIQDVFMEQTEPDHYKIRADLKTKDSVDPPLVPGVEELAAWQKDNDRSLVSKRFFDEKVVMPGKKNGFVDMKKYAFPQSL